MAAIWREPARIWPIITVWWLEGWLAHSSVVISSFLSRPISSHRHHFSVLIIADDEGIFWYFPGHRQMRISVSLWPVHPEEYQMQWTGILKIRFIYLFVFHSRQKKGNRKRGKWTQTRHRNLILLHFSHLIMRLVLSVVVWALLNNVCIVVFISKLRKPIYYSPNPPTYYYSQWHKHRWLTNMKLFAVKNAFVCIQFPADEKTHTQNLTRTMTRWEMGVL